MAIARAHASLSPRDRAILAAARRRLASGPSFSQAVAALAAATAELIEGGRVFVIGAGPIRGEAAASPIIGSQISGVGIVQTKGGIEVVRIERDGRVRRLGLFA
jgi:hypothetical protein